MDNPELTGRRDEPVTTAASSVADALVEMILGHLSPGASLPSEAELANQFAVSRLTIREAVKMLEGRGLLELAAGVALWCVSRMVRPSMISLSR